MSSWFSLCFFILHQNVVLIFSSPHLTEKQLSNTGTYNILYHHFQVVLASSSAGMQYEPLTSVNFKTSEGKNVTLELNKEQLNELITAMDAAVKAASELER